ncbi:MAG: 2'-5' RNA ligase family protein [Ilumatobacter sp.]|nr:2'-5' RNA ligase family protein [Ilumatobacter sp.]
MSRLFVCLWLPDHTCEALKMLHREDQVGARFVTPENWHVTLRFIGKTDPTVVAAAIDATRGLGDQPIRPRFLGHVTIARLKKRATTPRTLGDLVYASWRPAEVALVESTLRADGTRYQTLATWPIG